MAYMAYMAYMTQMELADDALTLEAHKKDIEGLKVKIVDLVQSGNSMKAAKRVITQQRGQDPDNKLHPAEIEQLYLLFEDPSAELSQICAFWQTLLDMRNHPDPDATRVASEPQPHIKRIVHMMRRHHNSYLDLAEIMDSAYA